MPGISSSDGFFIFVRDGAYKFRAEQGGLRGGEIVAVWGAGPVGQFVVKSAWLQGASRVIVIDRFAERLAMATEDGMTVGLNYEDDDILDALKDLSGGRGPDICIEAVGMEAHQTGLEGTYDRVKQELKLETDRPNALRQAIMACRKGGTLSVAGVFGGFLDKLPMGAAFNKGLTWKMGQTHVHRYLRPLLGRIESGEIDPRFVITHRRELDEAPDGYRMFRDKEHSCIKVVMTP